MGLSPARDLILAGAPLPAALAITTTTDAASWDTTSAGQPYKFDVYQPTTPRSPSPPAVVVLHGTFTGSEDKSNSNIQTVAQYVAKCGFVALVPNWYQTEPAADLTVTPNETERVEAFMTYARSHGATYHYDQTRIGVLGCSSGGNLGAMAAVHGVSGGTRPDAVSAWSGPHSFVTMDPVTKNALHVAYCGKDYNLNIAILADNPVGYWRFGEASGTSAADATANGNTGTYTGTFTLAQAGGLSGDTDTAVLLNGTTGYVTFPDSTSLDTLVDTFTLEIRFKLSGGAGTLRCLFSKGTNAYTLRLNASNQIELAKVGGSVVAHTVGTFTDTNWHHVMLTKSGATVHIVVDGSDDTVAGTAQTMAATALALNIGRTLAATQFFPGTLDEAAVYATALSAARCSAHYVGSTSNGETIWNQAGAATYAPLPGAICPVQIIHSTNDDVPWQQGQALFAALAGIAGIDQQERELGTLPTSPVDYHHGAAMYPYCFFYTAAWLGSRLSYAPVIWGRDTAS